MCSASPSTSISWYPPKLPLWMRKLAQDFHCIIVSGKLKITFMLSLEEHYRRSTCSRVLSHILLFVTPWTVAQQASLPMRFSRQEYWNGLPFPSSGDLPDPGIEPASLASPVLKGRFFHHCATWEAQSCSTLDSNLKEWIRTYELSGRNRNGKLDMYNMVPFTFFF